VKFLKKRGYILVWTITIALVCVMVGLMRSQSVQDAASQPEKGVPALYITCNPDSFAIISNRYREDIYLQSTLQIGKQVWKNVRLRLRGDTSREFIKKSIKLKIPNGKYLPFGRTTLNLNAEFNDKTYMRQYLCTRIFQDSGQPCYQTRHVTIHLNGVFQGIYLLVESVDGDFLEARDLSKKGDLFKATRDGACLSSYDDIQKLWERKAPKKDSTWTALEELIHLLNATPDAEYVQMVHANFNYRNMVNDIAVNMLIGNRSTYYHNYYMYRSAKKKQWSYLPWDMDNTFQPLEVTDPYQRGNNSDTHWGDMPSNPFFERALVAPEILKDIQARIDTLGRTIYNPEYLNPIIDSLAKELSPFIPMDTLHRKRTMETWQKEIEALKGYIAQRVELLQAQFAHNPTSFRLIQPMQPLPPNGILRWHPASDPDGDTLTYRVCYSSNNRFPSDLTRCYIGIKDTFFMVPSKIPAGTYFWKVLASDGAQEIRGFDNRCTFDLRDK
jgi:spore coat protein H